MDTSTTPSLSNTSWRGRGRRSSRASEVRLAATVVCPQSPPLPPSLPHTHLSTCSTRCRSHDIFQSLVLRTTLFHKLSHFVIKKVFCAQQLRSEMLLKIKFTLKPDGCHRNTESPKSCRGLHVAPPPPAPPAVRRRNHQGKRQSADRPDQYVNQ